MPEVQTLTLAEFLLARFDEDEAVARSVLSGYADHKAGWDCPSTGVVNLGDPGIEGLLPTGDGPLAEHIANWDPTRVLAECEAKRRIVELHRAEDRGGGWGSPPRWCCTECGGRTAHPNFGWVPASAAWPCPTLRALAAVYADHPDYRPEWRP